MRADRLLSLLMLLQARGRMTAAALAQELEVSERTIYRDVEALSLAGVPLYADRGHHGGIALLENYRTTLTGLTAAEVRAVLMISIPSPLADLGMEQELLSALRKLNAALPAVRLQDAAHLRQRIHIDSSPWQGNPAVPAALSHLQALQKAAEEDRRVQIVYALPLRSLQITREVSVYGLVAKAGEWYAICAWDEWVRPITASWVVSVTPREEFFQRPPGFDLVSFWQSWCESAREDFVPSYRVQVRVPESAAEIFKQLYGSALDGQEQLETSAEGWQEFTLVFQSLEEARLRLLGFGGAVEVLLPLPLRLSMADFARAAAALYA